MGRQRKSREVLLQLLFQAEAAGAFDPHQMLQELSKSHEHLKTQKEDVKKRACDLFIQIMGKKEELDQWIGSVSQNWHVGRMGSIDRNVLRVAAYELKYCPDVPGEVILDEAIEIAKRYGSEESGKFVNGILDKLFNEVRAS